MTSPSQNRRQGCSWWRRRFACYMGTGTDSGHQIRQSHLVPRNSKLERQDVRTLRQLLCGRVRRVETTGEATQLLRGKAEELRSKLGGKVSMARLLAVVADVPCPSRCVADLSHPVYGNIDSFYSTRHEFLRTLLVDSGCNYARLVGDRDSARKEQLPSRMET